MLLSSHHAARVFGSPAVFARKVDLERRDGVEFMAQWDQWMSYKMKREADAEAATETAGGAATEVAVGANNHSATQAVDGATAGVNAARGVGAYAGGDLAGGAWVEAWSDAEAARPEGQPAIGADLFAPNGSLLRPLPLPSTVEHSQALGGGASAVSSPPHAAHYGSEDMLAPSFGDPAHPLAEEGASASDTARLAAAATVVMAARAGQRVAAPPALAPLASRRRVAGLRFEDGSSCRCDADCRGARRKYALGCCIDWGHVCEGEASVGARS
jgi:hypothetical protein